MPCSLLFLTIIGCNVLTITPGMLYREKYQSYLLMKLKNVQKIRDQLTHNNRVSLPRPTTSGIKTYANLANVTQQTRAIDTTLT